MWKLNMSLFVDFPLPRSLAQTMVPGISQFWHFSVLVAYAGLAKLDKII